MDGSSPTIDVGFLGPIASYTHSATTDSFPESQSFKHLPLKHIEDVFSAVQSQVVAFGVIPYENSTNGAVAFTLDLLSRCASDFAEVEIVGEAFVAIHHNLLGRATGRPSILNHADSGGSTGTTRKTDKPDNEPLADLSHIHTLISHPQAWTQCETFLSTFLEGCSRQDASSTAEAASLAAADKSGHSAAIASVAAAEESGLDLLAKGIEDRGDNTTRFLIIRNSTAKPIPSERLPAWLRPGSDDLPPLCLKSLLAFTINKATSNLGETMAIWKEHEMEVCNVQSRPSGKKPWHYVFFVEVVGDEKDKRFLEAEKKLLEMGCWLKRLGSWTDRSEKVI